MVRLVLVGLCFLSLMGCSMILAPNVHTVADWSEVDAGEKPDLEFAKAAFKRIVGQSLRDPEATRYIEWQPLFKNLRSYQGWRPFQPVWQLCAQVNGKNAYGGYVGYEWYFLKFAGGEPVTEPGVGYGKDPLVGYYEDAHRLCEQAPNNPYRR